MEILNILAFGSFWFWVLIGTSYFIVSSLVESEKHVFATLILLSFLGAFHYIGIINLLSIVNSFSYVFVLYFIGYIILGIIWSLIKWYNYLKKWADKHENLNAEEFEKELPRSSDSWEKQRIIGWMIYWPFSLAGTILNLKKLYKKIFNLVSNFYSKIENHIKKKFITRSNKTRIK